MQAGGSVQRIAIIVVTIILGAILGLAISQYAPLFGGVEKFGQPWSEARMNLVPVHVIVFAILGFVLGLFVPNSMKTASRADAPNDAR